MRADRKSSAAQKIGESGSQRLEWWALSDDKPANVAYETCSSFLYWRKIICQTYCNAINKAQAPNPSEPFTLPDVELTLSKRCNAVPETMLFVNWEALVLAKVPGVIRSFAVKIPTERV